MNTATPLTTEPFRADALVSDRVRIFSPRAIEGQVPNHAQRTSCAIFLSSSTRIPEESRQTNVAVVAGCVVIAFLEREGRMNSVNTVDVQCEMCNRATKRRSGQRFCGACIPGEVTNREHKNETEIFCLALERFLPI